MTSLLKFLLQPYYKYLEWKRLRARRKMIEEMKKRDPFIY
jgi:hypothetical protein